MESTLIDLTGQRFGRWTVIGRGENRKKRVFWTCKCDCGTIKDVASKSLRFGNSKSCGCFRKENKGRPANSFSRNTLISSEKKRKVKCERCGGAIYTAATVNIPRYCSTCRHMMKDESTPIDRLNNPDIRKCRTCQYREYYNATIDGKQYYGCQYLNIVGEKRPCKPGNDCVVYEKIGG